MELVLIAAVAKNNVIGVNGKIPWHIKNDLKRFKQLTLHHPVLMGRKTYKSIVERIGKPLEGRMSLVLSRDASFRPNYANVTVCGNINDAHRIASSIDKICYVIGGQNIYEQTIDLADRLEITEIDKEFEGDAFFPEIDNKIWHETFRRKNDFYSFVTYNRVRTQI